MNEIFGISPYKTGKIQKRQILGLTARVNLLFVSALLIFGAISTPAAAVPSFGAQTGQPCSSCHVGGFGPQLTPFGREFKTQAYTMRTNKKSLPLSMMAIASYLRTAEQQDDLAPDFSTNDNVSLDELSLFLAGGVGNHVGGFVQGTYDGVDESWALDNVDLRVAATATVKGANVVLGASLNNSPTVQDIWNSLPGFGYPYTDSGLAPGPSAAPVIADSFAQNTIGLTGYAWINSSVYIEAGGYRSLSASVIDNLGVDPGETMKIKGTAPYARIAYQKNWGDQNIEVGAFGLFSHVFPERDTTAGVTDRITDLGIDASYQLFRANKDVFTINGRYTHESQRLPASQFLGLAANAKNTLQDIRIDASYYWRNKFGLTAGAFNSWGSSDPQLYSYSRTFSPNSSGLLFQIDATPFGGRNSPLGPRFNLRVGVQYVTYFRIDGASNNFDGFGRDASDDNTFRIFGWVAC